GARRVGGQRGTARSCAALFQPPPSEPCWTLSMSHGSPVVHAEPTGGRPSSLPAWRSSWHLPRFLMISSTTSALRITRTSVDWTSNNLPPFAWTSCPVAGFPDRRLLRRLRCRGVRTPTDNRAFPDVTLHHGLGPPFIPTPKFITWCSSPRTLHDLLNVVSSGVGGVRCTRRRRNNQCGGGTGVVRPGLGFKQCSLDHVVRVLRSGASTGLLALRFTDRLLSPTPFPVSGKSVGPGRIGSTASFLGKGCHIKQNAARPRASPSHRAPPIRIAPRFGEWPRKPARSEQPPAGWCGRCRRD